MYLVRPGLGIPNEKKIEKNCFLDCSGDFHGQMNCPNSFPETNLFSKNQRLLVKSQEKFFRDTSSLRKNFSVTLQVSGKIFP